MRSQPILTSRQAYAAMYAYLSAVYERTGTDDLGALLGGMSLLPDGGTADPAAWVDWEAAVRQAVRGNVDTRLSFR